MNVAFPLHKRFIGFLKQNLEKLRQALNSDMRNKDLLVIQEFLALKYFPAPLRIIAGGILHYWQY